MNWPCYLQKKEIIQCFSADAESVSKPATVLCGADRNSVWRLLCSLPGGALSAGVQQILDGCRPWQVQSCQAAMVLLGNVESLKQI